MLVISASMPKTGSTLVATYQERLLDVSGQRSGQKELKQYFGGRYVDAPTPGNLTRLVYINARYGSLVVKNHWAISNGIKLLTGIGVARVTMCIRDPRDILLSAIDHGARTRAKGQKTGGFAEFTNISDSIQYVQQKIKRLMQWTKYGVCHFIKYENLMDNPEDELRKMAIYLDWSVDDSSITTVIEEQFQRRHNALNFNKGVTGRWHSELNEEDKHLTTKAFLPFIEQMGYPVNG